MMSLGTTPAALGLKRRSKPRRILGRQIGVWSRRELLAAREVGLSATYLPHQGAAERSRRIRQRGPV